MDTIIVSLMLSMFFLSGIQKIFAFDRTVESIGSKIGNIVNLKMVHQLLIIAVILIEVIAPVLVVSYFATRQNKTAAYYGVISLILFTIIVTAIYHPPNFSSYMKSVPFWSNVSCLGGLLLLAKYI
jgi:uncharacterized membrane protein YphA (DoxX/SURF4 family)